MLIDVLTLVLSLGIVIGLIYLTYWLSQKANLPRMNVSQSKYMQIMDRIMVGRDRSIVIVKVQQQFYLLSISEQGVKLIDKLDSDFDESQWSNQPQQFNQMLQGVFKNKKSMEQKDEEKERNNP